MGKVYEVIIEYGDGDDSFETKIKIEAENDSGLISSKRLGEMLTPNPPVGCYFLRPIDKISFREVE